MAVAAFLYFGVQVSVAAVSVAMVSGAMVSACAESPPRTCMHLPWLLQSLLTMALLTTALLTMALLTMAILTMALTYYAVAARRARHRHTLTLALTLTLTLLQSLLDAREIGISGEDNAGIAEEREDAEATLKAGGSVLKEGWPLVRLASKLELMTTYSQNRLD